MKACAPYISMHCLTQSEQNVNVNVLLQTKRSTLSSQMRDQRVDYPTNLRSNLFLCNILADLQPLSEFNPAFTSMTNSRIRVVPHHPVTHLSSMKCLLFKTHRLVLPIKDFYHPSATKSRCTYGTH